MLLITLYLDRLVGIAPDALHQVWVVFVDQGSTDSGLPASVAPLASLLLMLWNMRTAAVAS